MRIVEPRKKLIKELKKLGFDGTVYCMTLGKSTPIDASSMKELAEKILEHCKDCKVLYVGELYYHMKPIQNFHVWIAGDIKDEYGALNKG